MSDQVGRLGKTSTKQAQLKLQERWSDVAELTLLKFSGGERGHKRALRSRNISVRFFQKLML